MTKTTKTVNIKNKYLPIIKPFLHAGDPTDQDSKQQLCIALLFSFLSSLAVLIICTRSSPLYPLNDWVDANCFMTVGKGMFHSKVVYRDLYEQKGVLLYFLHGLCSLISDDGFFGVFILELIAATFFLYYSYRIMRLYCTRACIITLPIMYAMICSSHSFQLGDSAEELCLPLLAYGLFVSLRAIKSDKAIGLREAILIGVTSGAVLWIKFSMLGFYPGWIIVPALLLLRRRQWKNLLMLIGGIVAGICLITLPFFIYFAVNGALFDWFEVYFYNNIFLYHVYDKTLWERFIGVWKLVGERLAYDLCYGFFVFLGLLYALLRLKVCEKLQILLTFAGTAILTYINGTAYLYYTLVLAAFVPFGMICTMRMLYLLKHSLCVIFEGVHIPTIKGRARTVAVIAAMMLSLFIGYYYSLERCPNTNLLYADRDSMPQYQFAKIINRKKDATLLNYYFLDGGFYLASNTLPNCRFFCTLNMEELHEMWNMQDEYVSNGLVDFVVTREYGLPYDNYELVDTCTYEIWSGQPWTFYLYQKIEQS